MDEKRRAELQKFLSDHSFNSVNVKEEELDIYDQALTHSSFAKEMKDRGIEYDDNERLEFLGNFVLNFVVSEYVFKRFKDDSEGDMTKRMKIVSNEKLAEIVMKKKIGIEELIQRGKGQDLEDSMVADAFEALIGAIYRVKGMLKTKKIILGMLSDEIENFNPERNYIGRLQEIVQIGKSGYLSYEVDKIEGPDHSPTFRAVVKILEKPCGEGTGNSKQHAKMGAAKFVLDKMEEAESGRGKTITKARVELPEWCKILQKLLNEVENSKKKNHPKETE
jgi:ribonuclease-3